MTVGYLVNPDMTHEVVDYDVDNIAAALGRKSVERLSVNFVEHGEDVACVYSAEAIDDPDAEPNPVASMGRAGAETGDSAIFTDPVKAVFGSALFVGASGEDISLEEIKNIHNGIRAARHYRDDFPEEFALWRASALNIERRREKFGEVKPDGQGEVAKK